VRTNIASAISTIDPAEWNGLDGTACPFLRHEFLATLESSGAVGPGTGWEPEHLLLRDADGQLEAAMPLYRKTNSWGEFVFDWAWADAYQRYGYRYYPKLVAAVPYTPATGPRCLLRPGAGPDHIRELVRAAQMHARDTGASSLHVLFPTTTQKSALESAGLLIRKDCQFHWHNRGYASFDEFLQTFTSAKRKKVRRERRRVAESGIRFRFATGRELSHAQWEELLPLYASSFWRRGREPYLDGRFFIEISRCMPDELVVIIAEHHQEPIAIAICFRGRDTLYGRYWGTAGRYHSLHFETCYYQGIEYCIRQGLACFEPGTQGEHKLSRGFSPTETWSAHWLSRPEFASAVDQYLERERDYIDDYIDAAGRHVPYRRSAR